MTAGVADLLLLEARGGWGSLCIEWKTRSKDSRQSANQKKWQAAAERAGNRYVVVRSLEAGMAVVKEYMGLPAITRAGYITSAELSAALSERCLAREDAANERERLKWR